MVAEAMVRWFVSPSFTRSKAQESQVTAPPATEDEGEQQELAKEEAITTN